MNHLFVQTDNFYLFLDESGTSEMKDKSEDFFILSCIKVEKHYYDQVFRKNVLKFKKKHKISKIVLHSSDIRKHRKGFDFLKGDGNTNLRLNFFQELSNLIQNLDFEIFYFSVNKREITDPHFDIYWHALREVLRMINNNLVKTNNILNIFCESRNNHQNNDLFNIYNVYFQELNAQHRFRFCFPPKLDFRQKDPSLYEMAGLEVVDLVSFPILNYVRNKVNKTASNTKLLDNYKIIKPKIIKNYHYNLHKQYKKPPMGADKLT